MDSEGYNSLFNIVVNGLITITIVMFVCICAAGYILGTVS